jgi:Flavodoxin
MNPHLTRRAVLSAGALLSTIGWLAACTTPQSPTAPIGTPTNTSPSETPPMPESSRSDPGRVLLAYFSRAGENYYYGGRRDLEVGNTEVLALMIAELTDVDLHKIEAADPYPDSYDATVARNVAEQDDNARPAIANPLDSIDGYTTVLLASPIWNVRAPMIMSSFTDAYDFTGMTVLPVVTYAVSGLGSVEGDYTAACPGARVGAGLAVRGEEVAQQRGQVLTWLQDAGLTTR